MRDAPAGTSFLQSLAEIDHRDHFHNHHALIHKNHEYLHRRQADASLEVDSTVASVTATVSVIQDIVIDSNGNTLQIQTWLAASTSVEAPPDPTVPAPTIVDTTPGTNPTTATPTPTPTNPSVVILASTPANTLANGPTTTTAPMPTPTLSASSTPTLGPLNTEMMSQWTSTQSTLSTTTSQALSLPLTSTPFLGTNSSISTGSSSSSGSSFQSPSSNSLTSAFHNHTTPNSLISSSSEISTSYSILSEFSTSLSSDHSSTASYDPSITLGPTVSNGAGAGGGSEATSSSLSTSTTGVGSAGGSETTNTAPSTPAVVGGVVAGVAGIVFIVALLMVLVRWRKHKQSIWRLGDGSSPEPRAIAGGTGGPSQPGGMTDRSLPFAIPAALANLTGYKRASHQPSIEASSTAGSERGFYRVSGRKLPSVLQHGGDGYGDGYEAGHGSLGGSSFYRDSRGFYGGPGSPVSPRAGRESGILITRPSPARTPVISEGAFGPPSPIPTTSLDPPRRPDTLGRSHPSRDGSHASKFTEEV